MPGLSFVYPSALALLLLLVPLWVLSLSTPRRLGPGRFWGSLVLRTAIIVTLVFSLAGTQIVTPSNNLATVFLIDSSDSVSPSARSQAEAFIREALASMPERDQAAIVVFGDNALVERAASPIPNLGRIASVPVASRTNIEEAIRLGSALFPADSQKRLVLLSDGGENTGNAVAAARLAAARNIPIDVVSLFAPPGEAEALVAGLDAPSSTREGQDVTLTASVESTIAQPARLRLFADQQLLQEADVSLQAGLNRFNFTVPASGLGFRRYRVQVETQQDGRAQNNEAAALVQVQGPPRVLLVEGTPGEAATLQNALTATNITAEVMAPANMPTDLAGLSAYDGVVLMNVPARALPVQTMAALPAYVRDLGKGLAMVGGDQSYGIGGYGKTPVEEALPVYMDVRDRQERPDLALVFVIDKSGSMDACHCSGPSRQSDMFQSGGERKIDIAKEAMVQAATVLTPQDKLGVVAFDDSAQTVLDPTQNITGEQVANSVASMEPRGGTRVRAGLRAAEEMLDNTDARIKHVILLTDGWGHGGDNLDLAQQMRDKGMTLTVVAAGSGSAEYLEQLAQTGGGRYYPTDHMSEVPQIFLQETVTTLGNYIVEQPITPAITAESPVLSGISSFPTLYGYNGTTIKETARQVLAAGNQAPLLATWQFGLGRAAAWTSDTKTRWGRDLVNWPEFPRFASQMMSWILPTRSGQNVNTEVQVSGGRAEITVGLGDENGPTRSDVAMTATVIGSDGSRQEVPLTQVAPGQYRGSLSSPATGTYLVQIAGTAEGRAVVQETAGLVVPYSAEYRQDQANPALLAQLRELTNGTELNFTNAAAAFAATNERVSRAQEIGLPLLWLALLLLPLDIAVRRLLLWSRGKNREPGIPPLNPPASGGKPEAGTRNQESGTKAPPTNPDDPLARLQAARDRARRRLKGEE